MKKHHLDFVPAVLAGFCTAALLIAPFSAHADSIQNTFEIVRPGDHAMLCPALAAEINQLGQTQLAAAESKPKKRGGLGFLRTLGSAVPMVGVVGGMGGALVSTVAGTASQITTSKRTDRQMSDAQQVARDAMAGGSAAQQRKERLLAIFEEKKC